VESVFSPDGRLVATRITDNTRTGQSVGARPVRVWEVATARALASFPTPGAARFAFAPDGRTLVIAGTDGFRVYEMATRKESHAVTVTGVTRGRKPGPFATALAIGPGGRTVATGHDDGTALIWDATPPRVALGAADVDAAWKALADPDPKVGRVAVFRLADAPDLALRLFEDKLKPAVPDPGTAALVRRLGSEDFKERETAEKELRALGTRAAPALVAALAGGAIGRAAGPGDATDESPVPLCATFRRGLEGRTGRGGAGIDRVSSVQATPETTRDREPGGSTDA
jgi:hypothetical protein